MGQIIETRKSRGTRTLLTVLAVWGISVVVASKTGLYGAMPRLMIGPLIALGIIIPVIIYFQSKGFREYIEMIGLRSITAFHIWRIAAAFVFFWYGTDNRLPETFVHLAGWGDLITGILALIVTLLPESRNRYLAFHIVGFTDFVVAVGTGLTLTIMNDPRMTGIQTLPMALIPLYGVGISGASHIMAFDLLRRRTGLHAKSKIANPTH